MTTTLPKVLLHRRSRLALPLLPSFASRKALLRFTFGALRFDEDDARGTFVLICIDFSLHGRISMNEGDR